MYSDNPELNSQLREAAAILDSGDVDQATCILQQIAPSVDIIPDEFAYDLVMNFARLWTRINRFSEAIRYARRAISLTQKLYGADDDRTAQAFVLCGIVHGQAQLNKEAKDYFENAIEILRRLYGPDSARVADIQRHLAFSLQKMGDIPAAIELFEHAIPILEHTDTLNQHVSDISILSLLYSDAGMPSRSRDILEKCLRELTNRDAGPELIAEIKVKLALATLQLEDYPEADKLLRESIQIASDPPYLPLLSELWKQVSMIAALRLPDTHDKIAKIVGTTIEAGKSAGELSGVQEALLSQYAREGRWADAERMLVETIKRLSQFQGSHHPEVLYFRQRLAVLYSTQPDRLQQSFDMLVEILGELSGYLPPEHPSIISLEADLATVQERLGIRHVSEDSVNQGVELLHKALSTREKAFGLRHPAVARVQTRLARVYEDQGDIPKAIGLLEESLKTLSMCYGENYPGVQDLEVILRRLSTS